MKNKKRPPIERQKNRAGMAALIDYGLALLRTIRYMRDRSGTMPPVVLAPIINDLNAILEQVVEILVRDSIGVTIPSLSTGVAT